MCQIQEAGIIRPRFDFQDGVSRDYERELSCIETQRVKSPQRVGRIGWSTLLQLEIHSTPSWSADNGKSHHRKSVIARSHRCGSMRRNVRRNNDNPLELECSLSCTHDVEVAVMDRIEHPAQN